MAAVTPARLASPVHPADADPDPMSHLRVLWAYQAHQPHWTGARIICCCGKEWEMPCPILKETLAAWGYPYE